MQPAARQVSAPAPASRPGPARSIAAIIHLPAPSVEKGKRQQGLDWAPFRPGPPGLSVTTLRQGRVSGSRTGRNLAGAGQLGEAVIIYTPPAPSGKPAQKVTLAALLRTLAAAPTEVSAVAAPWAGFFVRGSMTGQSVMGPRAKREPGGPARDRPAWPAGHVPRRDGRVIRGPHRVPGQPRPASYPAARSPGPPSSCQSQCGRDVLNLDDPVRHVPGRYSRRGCRRGRLRTPAGMDGIGSMMAIPPLRR